MASGRLVIAISLVILFVVLIALPSGCVLAAEPAIKIAADVSLTGPGAYYGVRALDGARLAVEEANAAADGSNFDLVVQDDESRQDKARQLAEQTCGTDASVVLGPVLTTVALAADPVFANCGLVTIPPTAHGDQVPESSTTFQPVFNGGEMGSSLATYLKQVLHGDKAIVLYRMDGYGQPFAEGFARAAKTLGLAVTTRGFSADAERDRAATEAANDPDRPAIALGMLVGDAAPILIALRRRGLHSPVLAPSALAGDEFVTQFAAEPEEKNKLGFFTDGVYAASPIMFDSANADTLAFAERFRHRYARDPSWPAVQGYDAAQLAIAAARNAEYSHKGDVSATRRAVYDYLASLSSPDRALPGVTGALWFNSQRHRLQAVRIGLFHDGEFDSAPVQLVPVDNPSSDEIASGEVFDPLPGQYVRRQRVVYTGIFLNEVHRLDLQRSSFAADFYLWMRFAKDAGPNAYDPTDISFPGMSGANFNRANPSEQRTLPDGTEYRLWHIEGEIRNEFDLRRFPFDRQTLRLSFFNARADASRIVYVLDRSSLSASGSQALDPRLSSRGGTAEAAPASSPSRPSVASGDALRELTQWRPLSATERRENLVTSSPLGDATKRQEGARELSGFVLAVAIERRVLATASKTLLPLLLMTIIMFASLYFPHGLVKEKVTVAITAALSGAVLLASVNSQLGNVGYTFAAEYAFYVFFGLSLLCIVSVLIAERFRASGVARSAIMIEGAAKALYLLAVAGVVVAATYLASSS